MKKVTLSYLIKVRAGEAVVGVPAQIGKAVLLGVGFQNPFLRRDLSRIYFVYQNAMNRVKNKTSLFHCKKHLERSGSKCFFLLCLAMPHPADPLTLPSP